MPALLCERRFARRSDETNDRHDGCVPSRSHDADAGQLEHQRLELVAGARCRSDHRRRDDDDRCAVVVLELRQRRRHLRARIEHLSSYNTSDTATATLSGTSMATPHVTGVAARYLQTHTTATPAQVRDA